MCISHVIKKIDTSLLYNRLKEIPPIQFKGKLYPLVFG
jgi:hypothetical protein